MNRSFQEGAPKRNVRRSLIFKSWISQERSPIVETGINEMAQGAIFNSELETACTQQATRGKHGDGDRGIRRGEWGRLRSRARKEKSPESGPTALGGPSPGSGNLFSESQRGEVQRPR